MQMSEYIERMSKHPTFFGAHDCRSAFHLSMNKELLFFFFPSILLSSDLINLIRLWNL